MRLIIIFTVLFLSISASIPFEAFSWPFSKSKTQKQSKVPQKQPLLNSQNPIDSVTGVNQTLNQALQNDTTGIQERVSGRQSARKLGGVGKTIEDTTGNIGETMSNTGKDLMIGTKNPHQMAVGGALSIIGTTTKTLGLIVGSIIQGVARYRGQNIFLQSATEQLIWAIEESFSKIETLSNQLEEMSFKRPTLKRGMETAPSLTDKFKSIISPSAWKGSVEDLLDKTYLTDFRGKRIEQAVPIQEALKKEKQNFEDLVRLLQIKLIQQTLQIKMIDLNPEPSIYRIKNDLETLKEAQRVTVQKVSSLDLKREAPERERLINDLKNLKAKIMDNEKELTRLMNLNLSPEEKEQISQDIATLQKEIEPLYKETRLYKARSQVEGSVEHTEEVVAKQKDLLSLQEQIATLQQKLEDSQEEWNAKFLNLQNEVKSLSTLSQKPTFSRQSMPPNRPLPPLSTTNNFGSQKSRPPVNQQTYRWSPPPYQNDN